MSLTYWSYLKIDELLSLQERVSDGPEHDEMLFIVIHQVYELWFKQVLHEIDRLRSLLVENETPSALGALRRVLKIFKTLVAQVDVIETMTPLEFLSFRDRLESGSGFESYQFRELEYVLGVKNTKAILRYPEGSSGHTRLTRRLAEPTLWDAFLAYLRANGYDAPEREDVSAPAVTSAPGLQDVLVKVYREDPRVASVCERLVDLDEGLQEWRYRHVMMVQRTIGTKKGTGGSAGVEYLKSTLFQPVFPDLWGIRTQL
jgi:tryptophan 2,3-dioxygenase